MYGDNAVIVNFRAKIVNKNWNTRRWHMAVPAEDRELLLRAGIATMTSEIWR